MFFHAEAYDRYMGRWSRRLAPRFLEFAGVAEGSWVLDLGTGTGSLALMLAAALPAGGVVGIDASAAYVGYAHARTTEPRIRFVAGDAQALPFRRARRRLDLLRECRHDPRAAQ
jgi:ubiquinone/menaquinone biosynthesis C-methylase UbiE